MKRSFWLIMFPLMVAAILGTWLTVGVRAAPAAGGTFVVSSIADNNIADGALTLREALLIARGGTGASGLNRALTPGEEARISGCTIDGSNLITSGCGAGIADEIDFLSSLGTGATIVVGAQQLPPIDDNAATTVFGGTIRPVINAGAIVSTQQGLRVQSDNNSISNIVVENSPNADFYVTGAHNTLLKVGAFTAGGPGVALLGDNNTLDQANIGVINPNVVGCDSKGNSGAGVRVANGAVNNTISGSYIGCNGSAGLRLEANASGTVITGNFIGIANVGERPNQFYGILIHDGARLTTIGDGTPTGSNYIELNFEGGVVISQSTTISNTVRRNTINSNSKNGVLITGGAHGNIIGGTSIGNTISNQDENGIAVQNGAHHNTISANTIQSNQRNGIELSGAGTTANLITNTTIGFNTLDGINERNGADGNAWSHLLTQLNDGLPVDKAAGNDANNTLTPPLPQITGVSVSAGTVTVHGHTDPHSAPDSVKIELYRLAKDVFHQPYLDYVDSGSANLAGNWTIAFTGAEGCFVAFQTLHNGVTGADTSSEFGPNSCLLFLPVVSR